MKIYLAGDCSSEHRTLMVRIADYLRDNLHIDHLELYCPWELKIENAWSYSQEDWSDKVFNTDITAIHDCSVFIMVSCGRHSTAGTNWEQGFAYCLGKPIIVIQITNDPTSLMTYCGCDIFINTDVNSSKFKDDINYIINMLHISTELWTKDKCETTLT